MRDHDYLRTLQHRLRASKELVESEFGNGLGVEALNWKPARERWSIAQCLDHLLVSDEAYFPTFDQLVLGDFFMSPWERFSPLSGFFGRLMVKSVTEAPTTKMKAPKLFQPWASAIDADIVARFVQHQDAMATYLDKLAAIDLDATIITSPPLHLITYSLRNALTLLVQHQERHIRQALQVKLEQGTAGA